MLDPRRIALQGLTPGRTLRSVAMQGLVAVQAMAAHTSGGGGGVQSAQKRRLRERAQEEEEIAMVLTVLAQIGVFA